jgi:hypothetical protein
MLQFSREVDLLWRRKLTWATILYMTARYALFIAYATPILANVGPDLMTPEVRYQTVTWIFDSKPNPRSTHTDCI